tara:strand:+ start:3486 stop:3719 length:234 start_codon:yes stop_codon:yes gene_type:complete
MIPIKNLVISSEEAKAYYRHYVLHCLENKMKKWEKADIMYIYQEILSVEDYFKADKIIQNRITVYPNTLTIKNEIRN